MGTKISALPAMTGGDLSATDIIPIVDDIGGTPTTKKVALSDLTSYIGGIVTLTPGGSTNDIQINGGGYFIGGGPYMDGTTLYAAAFSGDGSALTALAPANINGYPTDATKFLCGNGTWAVPPGGLGSSGVLGDIQRSDGAGGFIGDSGLNWEPGGDVLNVVGSINLTAGFQYMIDGMPISGGGGAVASIDGQTGTVLTYFSKDFVFGNSVETILNTETCEFSVDQDCAIVGWAIHAGTTETLAEIMFDVSLTTTYPSSLSSLVNTGTKPSLSVSAYNFGTTSDWTTINLSSGDSVQIKISGTPNNVTKATLTLKLRRR